MRSKYEALVANAVLSSDELELAQRSARRKNLDLETVLADEFQVKAPDLGKALSVYFGVPYEPLKTDRIRPQDLLKNMSREFCETNQWVPLGEDTDGLLIMTLDPERTRASRMVVNVYPKSKIVYSVTTLSEFTATLEQMFGGGLMDDQLGDIGDLLGTLDDEESEGGGEDIASAASDNELVKLVNKVIIDAYKQGASDIHIEPYPGKAKTEVRFRRDGALMPYISIPGSYRNALAARIKIMCDLDISERRKPQDGKIKFKKFGPLDIELRVATIPTAGGVEDIVMRILAGGEPIPLDKLGLSSRNLALCKSAIEKPYGLFFVCGPTGSGQDDHFAFGAGLSQSARHEDLDGRRPRGDHAKRAAAGAGQQEGGARLRDRHESVPARRSGHHHGRRDARQGDGIDGHRSVAHRPPRVRDAAYEQRAGVDREAARHGHGSLQLRRCAARHPGAASREAAVQVQGGAHRDRRGNRAPGRRVCAGAALHRAVEKDRAGEREKLLASWVKEFGNDKGEITLYAAKGCDVCAGTGYKGRVGLHELLIGSDLIKRHVQEHARVAQMLATALEEGMRTLKQDGIEKVLQGITDIQQVRSVCIK